jgi:hypothetical protein
MVASFADTTGLFTSLDATWSELLALISATNGGGINAIPFPGSWSAAQVFTHITKSNKAFAQGMEMEGKPAERAPDASEPEIRKIFLDFETKFKSPEFIVPEVKIYDKNEVTRVLKSSIDKLSGLRSKINLFEIIALPIFGEITKLELLYFVLYHTQRHIYQLKKIFAILKSGPVTDDSRNK